MYVFMHKYFLIGNFYFELIYPDILTLPEHFMLFETDRRHIPADYRYQLSLSGHFPAPEGIRIVKRPDLTVFRVSGHLECRYIGISGIPGYYGCCQERSDLEARIFLHPDRIENLNSDPVFVSLFALERRMSAKNALILHCAYISYKNQAILFSAPSGIGKTTQARLWEKYRGSRTVNGDRALLQIKDGQWHAEGWPVCGTSGICRNEVLPLGAIVLLSQGTHDKVSFIKSSETFKLLYAQITVNSWQANAVRRTICLSEHLLQTVPVFQFQCTISGHAVDKLDHALQFITEASYENNLCRNLSAHSAGTDS